MTRTTTKKVVIIGASGVGKTSLRSQYITQRFSTGYRATIGADFVSKSVKVPAEGGEEEEEEEEIVLQIWDTAGQERFSSLSSAFFRGADAVVMVYDVNRRGTMEELERWWGVFRDGAGWGDADSSSEDEAAWTGRGSAGPSHSGNAGWRGGGRCAIVVGNKLDLGGGGGEGEGQVGEGEGDAFVRRLLGLPPTTASTPTPIASTPTYANDLSPHSGGGGGGGRYGTMNTVNTTLTIYHTPSSSFAGDGDEWDVDEGLDGASMYTAREDASIFTSRGSSVSRSPAARSTSLLRGGSPSLERSASPSSVFGRSSSPASSLFGRSWSPLGMGGSGAGRKVSVSSLATIIPGRAAPTVPAPHTIPPTPPPHLAATSRTTPSSSPTAHNHKNNTKPASHPVPHFRTSAKSGEGVEGVFGYLVLALLSPSDPDFDSYSDDEVGGNGRGGRGMGMGYSDSRESYLDLNLGRRGPRGKGKGKGGGGGCC